MRVVDAAAKGRIKIELMPDGGADIIGRRSDVLRIAKAVSKRQAKDAKRLANRK